MRADEHSPRATIHKMIQDVVHEMCRGEAESLETALLGETVIFTSPESQTDISALEDLIRRDMEKEWTSGNGPLLEEYVGLFPEIASRGGVSTELIIAEFDIRCRFDRALTIHEYQQRFPQQWAELVPYLERFGKTRSEPPELAPAVPRPTGKSTPPRPGSASAPVKPAPSSVAAAQALPKEPVADKSDARAASPSPPKPPSSNALRSPELPARNPVADNKLQVPQKVERDQVAPPASQIPAADSPSADSGSSKEDSAFELLIGDSFENLEKAVGASVFGSSADFMAKLLESVKAQPPERSNDGIAPPNGRAPANGKAPAPRGLLRLGFPEQLGRYRIVRQVGEGAMGTVFLAEDTLLDRPVALKIPTQQMSMNAENVERFYREARAAAKLHHPNLCPVYDVGEFEGFHFLTMAFIDGVPLSELQTAVGGLRVDDIVFIVRRCALALQEAHDAGIVHRDLKPSNIMIDKRGEPVIMDFGLALSPRDAEHRLTKVGAFLGTPAYMSPEQVCGAIAQIGPATDIYSLGVILYELLTGQTPFMGSIGIVLAKIMSETPKAPSLLREDIDGVLDGICLRAMEKRIENRFPSSLALAEALT